MENQRQLSGSSHGNHDLSGAMVMQNELVLAKIARHLPVPELVTLRQTCVAWNGALLPSLRGNHSPIKLVNRPGGGNTRGGWRHLCEYTKIMKLSSGIPFGGYELSEGEADLEEIEELFAVCGPSMRHLHFVLSAGSFRSHVTILRRALGSQLLSGLADLEVSMSYNTSNVQKDNEPGGFPKLPELPNLKRFVLPNRYSRLTTPCSEFLTDVIHSATDLKSLILANAEYNMVAASALQGCGTQHLRLEHLKMTELKAPELKALTELTNRRLRLKSLQLTYRRDGADEEFRGGLYSFLATQAVTLRKLRIHSEPIPGEGRLCIPKLEQLDTFEFLQLRMPLRHVLEEGNLRDNFPSLKCLKLDDFESPFFERTLDEESTLVPHPGVTEVKLFVNNLTPRLGAWLPCVTSCNINVTLNAAAIWTTWPALVVLDLSVSLCGSIKGEHKLDEFLTGIPACSHGVLMEELENRPLNLEVVRELLERYKTGPGLSDLSRLEKFTMKLTINPPATSCIVTDISGCFALATASPTLKHFEIEGQPTNRISDRCHEFIRSALRPNLVINI